MIRPVLTELVLFLLPFAAYAGFLWATRAAAFDPAAWSVSRLASLLIAAFGLMVGGFLMLAGLDAAPPGSTYVPAHVDSGKLSPGQTR
jgi:hypothetical protein